MNAAKLILPVLMALLLVQAVGAAEFRKVQPATSPLSKLVSQVSPSVVRVFVLVQKDDKFVTSVIGSGFVVGPQGLVVTAAHVIKDVPVDALLIAPADADYFKAEDSKVSIISIDRERDVALLRSVAVQTRKALKLEETSDVAVGEDALLFGFPLGDPVLTVSKGMVAAKTTRPLKDAKLSTRLIKLDASVNKGNSGGPLVRVSTGKVIGMACLKEGSIQESLQKLLKEKPMASISIGGNDPIALLQTVVRDFEVNLQLGLGYAVASEHIITLMKSRK